MKLWTEMSAAARWAVVAGVAVVLAIFGYFGLGRPPAPPPPVPLAEVAAPAADPAAPAATAPAAAEPAAAEPAAAEPAVVEPIYPALDVVRITPEGSATVAGTAGPGATVSLRIDGAEVIQVTADPNGNFVALFDLIASELPRLLSVVAIGADGVEIPGRDTVAIAPIAAPVATAAAEPEAASKPPALRAPAAILVSPDGVKVLQPATDTPAEVAAEVAANVFVDTIAYTADGAVQLGGHGQAGQAIRVYLDGAAKADAAIGADGTWSLVLPEVAPGLYTLRVDQLADDGSVTSRFETPFKRETLEALAAATAEAAGAVAAAAESAAAAPEQQAAMEAAAEATVSPEPGQAVAAPEAAAAAEPDASAAASSEAAPEVAADAAADVTVAEPVAESAANVTADVTPAAEAPVAEPVTAPAAPAVAVDTTAPEPAPVAPTADAPTIAGSDPAPQAAGLAEAVPVVAEGSAPPAHGGLVAVTVQPGFTLWGIAKEQFGAGIMYVQVFDANREKIKDPDLIYPGQIFLIPGKN